MLSVWIEPAQGYSGGAVPALCAAELYRRRRRVSCFAMRCWLKSVIELRSVTRQQDIHPTVFGPPLRSTIGGYRLPFAIGVASDLAG